MRPVDRCRPGAAGARGRARPTPRPRRRAHDKPSRPPPGFSGSKAPTSERARLERASGRSARPASTASRTADVDPRKGRASSTIVLSGPGSAPSEDRRDAGGCLERQEHRTVARGLGPEPVQDHLGPPGCQPLEQGAGEGRPSRGRSRQEDPGDRGLAFLVGGVAEPLGHRSAPGGGLGVAAPGVAEGRMGDHRRSCFVEIPAPDGLLGPPRRASRAGPTRRPGSPGPTTGRILPGPASRPGHRGRPLPISSGKAEQMAQPFVAPGRLVARGASRDPCSLLGGRPVGLVDRLATEEPAGERQGPWFGLDPGLERSRGQVGHEAQGSQGRTIRPGGGDRPLEPVAWQLLGSVVVGRERQLGSEGLGKGEAQQGDPKAEPDRVIDQEDGPSLPDHGGQGRQQAGQRHQLEPLRERGDIGESRRSEKCVGRQLDRLGRPPSTRLAVRASPEWAVEQTGGPLSNRSQLGRIEPEPVGEVTAGPSPGATLGLVLVGPRGQPGDLGDPTLEAIPEGRGRQRPAPARERPEPQVSEIDRDRITRAQTLDLEPVAGSKSIANRALRVVDLLHARA